MELKIYRSGDLADRYPDVLEGFAGEDFYVVVKETDSGYRGALVLNRIETSGRFHTSVIRSRKEAEIPESVSREIALNGFPYSLRLSEKGGEWEIVGRPENLMEGTTKLTDAYERSLIDQAISV
jgi:hypothetical protein